MGHSGHEKRLARLFRPLPASGPSAELRGGASLLAPEARTLGLRATDDASFAVGKSVLWGYRSIPVYLYTWVASDPPGESCKLISLTVHHQVSTILGMSEREFAAEVVSRLTLHGYRCLRVCDYVEGRRGVFGLRAPGIKSPGADYLIVPTRGMPVHVARSVDEIFHEDSWTPYFLELKEPGAKKRYNEQEQEKWIQFVRRSR